MPGDFFAEPYNVHLFVGVLGTLTFMMSGCYVYHKWKHIKSKNSGDVYIPKKRRKKFLRRASACSGKSGDGDQRQMQLEAEGNFNTPVVTPENFPHEGDDDVFQMESVPFTPVNRTFWARPNISHHRGNPEIGNNANPSHDFIAHL